LSPPYDVIHSRSGRSLCSRCSSLAVAKRRGLETFEHLQFDPVKLTDCSGTVHEFHFTTRLFGSGVSVKAFEVRNGRRAGYRAEIIGDPDQDPMILLARLIDKLRRMLSVKYLHKDRSAGLQIVEQTVQGSIEWNAKNGAPTPLLIIDGQEVAWEHFGRMLMTYEGSRFRLDIRDPIEDM
jgi:hypothetical protein